MKRFKKEYQYARVTVQSPSFGRMTVDTAKADPNLWANVPEFAFMLEDAPDAVIELPKKITTTIISDITGEDRPSYDDLTLNGLRELFPDIKAKTKAEFLSKIQ